MGLLNMKQVYKYRLRKKDSELKRFGRSVYISKDGRYGSRTNFLYYICWTFIVLTFAEKKIYRKF